MSLLVVVGQTVVIYLFLIVTLSRIGRSLRSELTSIGYVVIALVGSAVETALYQGSGSLAAGLASAATLVAADRATTALMNRWPRLRRWLVGSPVVLVHNGQILLSHLREVRLTPDDLLE